MLREQIGGTVLRRRGRAVHKAPRGRRSEPAHHRRPASRPPHRRTGRLGHRPTSDRAREALFAILEHATPLPMAARFLDLFSGSGAAALEAVSRGAAEALCVDQASAAVAAIRANVAVLGETDRVACCAPT